ncbi:MAG: hypothetical protein EBU90_23625 [Proteobacteria bacterium]|nr:hypothetical protein [Pseudomonadota bacterium]NBP16091.1 hypothetical protein [bacterium]
MLLSRQDLILPWATRGVIPKNFVISDKNYFAPTESIIHNSIYPHFKLWMQSLNLTKWQHDWDCDNFADAFKLFACGYYSNNIECEAEGIAIGVVNYMANIRAEDGSKGGHAANILFIEDNSSPFKFNIKFLEPQNGQIFEPKEDEFNSIWTVYI